MTSNFIKNLIKAINNSEYINWYENNGFSFDINNKKELVNDLKKYKVTAGNFTSFLRQISLYHFKNIKKKKDEDSNLKIYINKISNFNSKFKGTISREKIEIKKLKIKEIIKLNLEKLCDKKLSNEENDLKKFIKILEMEKKILIREKEAIEFNNSLKETKLKF